MKTEKLLLDLNGVSKDYGDVDVLRDINLFEKILLGHLWPRF